MRLGLNRFYRCAAAAASGVLRGWRLEVGLSVTARAGVSDIKLVVQDVATETMSGCPGRPAGGLVIPDF